MHWSSGLTPVGATSICQGKKQPRLSRGGGDLISTEMPRESFQTLSSAVNSNINSLVYIKPHGTRWVQIAFKLLRKLRRIMVPHFTLKKIHSQLASSRCWQNCIKRNTVPCFQTKISFALKNGTNCLLLPGSLRPSQLSGPSPLTWRLESKVSTYRKRGKANSLPLCERRVGCSTASRESRIWAV